MVRIKKPKQAIGRHFIRAWRKSKNLTQEQLANRIGIDRTHLGRIENGAIQYSESLLLAIADALGCEPADLIMRDPDSKVWSIHDTLIGVPSDQIPKIIAIIEAIKKTA